MISAQGAQLLVEVDGVPHRVSRDDRGFVRSLAPGVVVSIPVAPGDEVARGDVVAVLESMKMESSLTAPFHGRVRDVLVRPNTQVGAQTPLVQLEPLETAGERDGATRVSFAGRRGAPAAATRALPREAPAAGVAGARLRRRGGRGPADSRPSSTNRAAI